MVIFDKKFKIPPHEISAYGPKEHFYAFSALSYQNCGTSSKKTRKIGKKTEMTLVTLTLTFLDDLETYARILVF